MIGAILFYFMRSFLFCFLFYEKCLMKELYIGVIEIFGRSI